jgi:hypothetical protein
MTDPTKTNSTPSKSLIVLQHLDILSCTYTQGWNLMHMFTDPISVQF